MGFLAHPGCDGILFDVEQGGLVLGGRVNVLGLEMISPKVAIGAPKSVHETGMVALQVLHESRNGTLSQRFKHEVDVVGHEAKGMDADLATSGEGIETVQVVDQLGFAVEDALTLGAALIDVVDLAAFEGAESGRKLGSAFGGHLLISVFPAGKFSYIFDIFLRGNICKKCHMAASA